MFWAWALNFTFRFPFFLQMRILHIFRPNCTLSAFSWGLYFLRWKTIAYWYINILIGILCYVPVFWCKTLWMKSIGPGFFDFSICSLYICSSFSYESAKQRLSQSPPGAPVTTTVSYHYPLPFWFLAGQETTKMIMMLMTIDIMILMITTIMMIRFTAWLPWRQGL